MTCTVMFLWSNLVSWCDYSTYHDPAWYTLVKWCSSDGMSDSIPMVLFNVSLIPHGIHWSIIHFLTHACSQLFCCRLWPMASRKWPARSCCCDRIWSHGVTIQHITIPHGIHWSSDVLLLAWATLIPWFYSAYDRSRMASTGQSFAFILIRALKCFVTDSNRYLAGNDLHGHVAVIESGLLVTIQHITIPHTMPWSSDVLLMEWATLIPWFLSTYDRSRMASTGQSFAFLVMPALKWAMTCTVMLLWSNLVS